MSTDGINIGSIKGSVDVDTKQAIAGLKNVANQAKQSAAQLKQAQASSQQMSMSLKGMNASLGTVDKSLKGVNDLLGGTASQAGKLVGGVGKLSSALAGGFAGVAVAAAVAGLGLLVERFKQTEQKIKDVKSSLMDLSSIYESTERSLAAINATSRESALSSVISPINAQISRHAQEQVKLQEKLNELRKSKSTDADYFNEVKRLEKELKVMNLQRDGLVRLRETAEEKFDVEWKAHEAKKKADKEAAERAAQELKDLAARNALIKAGIALQAQAQKQLDTSGMDIYEKQLYEMEEMYKQLKKTNPQFAEQYRLAREQQILIEREAAAREEVRKALEGQKDALADLNKEAKEAAKLAKEQHDEGKDLVQKVLGADLSSIGEMIGTGIGGAISAKAGGIGAGVGGAIGSALMDAMGVVKDIFLGIFEEGVAAIRQISSALGGLAIGITGQALGGSETGQFVMGQGLELMQGLAKAAGVAAATILLIPPAVIALLATFWFWAPILTALIAASTLLAAVTTTLTLTFTALLKVFLLMNPQLAVLGAAALATALAMIALTGGIAGLTMVFMAAMKETEGLAEIQGKVKAVFQKVVNAVEPATDALKPWVGLLDEVVSRLVGFAPAFNWAVEAVSRFAMSFVGAGAFLTSNIYGLSAAIIDVTSGLLRWIGQIMIRTPGMGAQGVGYIEMANNLSSMASSAKEAAAYYAEIAEDPYGYFETKYKEVELIKEGNRARNEELLNLSGRRIRGARWRTSGGIA
jgi:hypothetical protein